MRSVSYTNALAAIEPVKMELPPLGSEFRGREEFLDEVIDTLNELQQVSEGGGGGGGGGPGKGWCSPETDVVCVCVSAEQGRGSAVCVPAWLLPALQASSGESTGGPLRHTQET